MRLTYVAHFNVDIQRKKSTLTRITKIENIELGDDTNYYFTNIEIVSDVRLEKWGPHAARVRLI